MALNLVGKYEMTSKNKKDKSKPTWVDVKAKIFDFDRSALIQLVADLYAADKNNQSFLHTRFSLGDDPLEIYRNRIHKALFPNVLNRNCDVKVGEAKKAISEYQKAIGLIEGVLELRLYFCEVALEFSMDYGYEEEAFFNAVFVQFKTAVKIALNLSGQLREDALDRLYELQEVATNVGYGLGDYMAELLDEVNPDDVQWTPLSRQ